MILRARPGQVGRTGVFVGALNRSDSSGGRLTVAGVSEGWGSAAGPRSL